MGLKCGILMNLMDLMDENRWAHSSHTPWPHHEVGFKFRIDPRRGIAMTEIPPVGKRTIAEVRCALGTTCPQSASQRSDLSHSPLDRTVHVDADSPATPADLSFPDIVVAPHAVGAGTGGGGDPPRAFIRSNEDPYFKGETRSVGKEGKGEARRVGHARGGLLHVMDQEFPIICFNGTRTIPPLP